MVKNNYNCGSGTGAFLVQEGGVAQGLEHSVHTRGVIGSNPITATRTLDHNN